MVKKIKFPWCKRDVFIQLGIVAGGAVYAGILLAMLHWAFTLVYIGLWTTFIVMNHYYVCRDCEFCGTLCGSFGLGRLALFKRTDREHFDPQKGRRSMLVFYITFIFPFPLLFFLPPYWLWAVLYLAGGIIGVIVHQKRGCAKCPLTHCSANPNHTKDS